jgi:hypothetical protein
MAEMVAMIRELMRKSTRDLLRMQKNFNATFKRKRDAGEYVAGLYRYLKAVEAELSRRGAHRW